MPIYDFACESCGHEFEAVAMMEGKCFQSCPKCAKRAKKILSPTKTVNRLNVRISAKKQRRRIM